MVEIIKKKRRDPIVTQIVFTATETQRKTIDQIKAQREDLDINAMFRDFTDKLIQEVRAEDPEAELDPAG